jgi:4'-phosphopantetheinyl transferase
MATRVVQTFFMTTAMAGDDLAESRALGALGPEERDTYCRMSPGPARRDYLAAHALARVIVSRAAGCAPGQLLLEFSRGKAPRAVHPLRARRIRFSISHAGGIALCALSAGCDVGADVETGANLGSDPLGIAELVCSPLEMKLLRALLPAERDDWLLWLWTVKEAVAKATGRGFRQPLTDITLRGGPAAGAFHVEIGSGHAPGATGRLSSLQITPRCVATVAALGRGQDFKARFQFFNASTVMGAEASTPLRPWESDGSG